MEYKAKFQNGYTESVTKTEQCSSILTLISRITADQLFDTSNLYFFFFHFYSINIIISYGFSENESFLFLNLLMLDFSNTEEISSMNATAQSSMKQYYFANKNCTYACNFKK